MIWVRRVSGAPAEHIAASRRGDDDGEAENRTGARVSATALHALGSAGEACAAVVFEAHQREIAVPKFKDGGSPSCQATHAAARGDVACQGAFVAGLRSCRSVWS